MKILVVSQYFWPENFRINDLCVELQKRGHQVTVLTGAPNYPEGKIFPEFSYNPKKFDELDGVNIIRVPLVVRGSGSVRLVLNYISFALMGCTLGLYKLRKQNFDVVFICQLSPIMIALPGILYKKLNRVPTVMWVLDLWPESLRSVGAVRSERILNSVGKLVSFIYDRCDLIFGQSPAFEENISLYTKLNGRFRVLYSWAEDIFNDIEQDISSCPLNIPLDRKEYFNIVFTGNVGEAQALDKVIRAFKIAIDKGAKVNFHIVGDGRALKGLKQLVVDLGISKEIIFYGRRPLEDMPSFYASSGALLVSLKSSDAFKLTIPGKVQSYMASKKAILAILEGEGARVINEAQSGLVSLPGDIEKLSENIIKISRLPVDDLENMAVAAKHYFDENFDKKNIVDNLERDLKILINEKLL